MSMLAERRSKVSYILNPKKTIWDAEENNFGKKLMEKMGWAAGKGLGKTEQGLTESIKVKYKNDSKGMGYAGPPDCPVKLQDEFSQLLADLNDSPDVATLPSTGQVASLEKRSESSRSRVHYRKFTRGKDLSRYSEKDLACIIGPEALGEKKKSKRIIGKEEEMNDEEKSEFGVPTTNGGLMGDYFKVKMKAKGLDIDEIEKKRKEEKVEEKRTSKLLLLKYKDILEKEDSGYNPLSLFKKSVKGKSEEENIEEEEKEEEEISEEPPRKKKKKEKELLEVPVKVKKSKKKKNKKNCKEIIEEEVVENVTKSKKSKHKKHKNKK